MRAHEAKLNASIPQFVTKVPVTDFGELNIHFVHSKSGKPGAVPLLFCHGCECNPSTRLLTESQHDTGAELSPGPGGFLEFTKVLPLLNELQDGLSFGVVCSSLPNFEFSIGTDKPGFRPPQYAEAYHRLMIKLGYSKHGTSLLLS